MQRKFGDIWAVPPTSAVDHRHSDRLLDLTVRLNDGLSVLPGRVNPNGHVQFALNARSYKILYVVLCSRFKDQVGVRIWKSYAFPRHCLYLQDISHNCGNADGWRQGIFGRLLSPYFDMLLMTF